MLRRARSCDRISSLRLSVTLVDRDHIGWNSSKIISRLVSLVVRSLQTSTINTTDLLPREHPEWNSGLYRGGVLKMRLSAYKGSNIFVTRQDRTKVTLRTNRYSHLCAFLSIAAKINDLGWPCRVSMHSDSKHVPHVVCLVFLVSHSICFKTINDSCGTLC